MATNLQNKATGVIISDNTVMLKERFQILHSNGVSSPAYQDISLMFMMYENNQGNNPDIFFIENESKTVYCIKWNRELRKKQSGNITFISFLQEILKVLANSYIDRTVDLFIESETKEIPIYKSYEDVFAYCSEVIEQKTQNANYEEHDENEWRKGYFIYENLRIKQILKGGMGIVYIVNHLKTGETFAMKSIQQKFLWNNDAYKMFIQEAETWIKLEKHPNIVRALTVRQINSRPFIFLEYVNNGSLEDILTKKQLTVQSATSYAIQIARGMSYAFQKIGLVHRDLKPANCLINDKDVLKITDFGLAKCKISQEEQEGIIQGTIQYMPPESAKGKDTGTPESDIYSFGVILYRMLTGIFPYKADNIGELLVFFDKGRIERPGYVKSNIPPRISAITMKCLEINPVNRYHSFEEIEKDLSEFSIKEYGKIVVSEEESQIKMTAEDLLKKGLGLAELGKHYESIEVYDEALKQAPTNVEILVARGESLYTVGGYNEAIKNFNEALKINDEDEKILTRKGDCFLALKRFQDALTCYNEALELNPENEETLISKSKYFLRTQKPRESIKLLDNVLKNSPDLYIALFYKGAALLDLKEPEESIVYFKKAHDENPRCIEAWIQHSYVLYTIRRYNESARYMQQLLELSPDCKEAGLLFIKAKTAAGKYDEAMSFMEKQGLQNADQEELSIYADIQLEMKDYEGALETLQSILYFGNSKNDLLAISLMDRLLLFENAKNTCYSLIQNNPNNIEAQEMMRSILQREEIFSSFTKKIILRQPTAPSVNEIIPTPPQKDRQIWESVANRIKKESYGYENGDECYLKYAYEAMRQNNYWLTIQILKGAIESKNGTEEVWSTLATLLQRLGYIKYAVFAYYQVIYISKKWEGWYRLAELYEKEGWFGEAALCGIQALRRGCGEIKIICKILTWLERSGHQHTTISIASEIVKMCRNDNVQEVLTKGILYLYAQRYTSARNMFESCEGDVRADLQILKIEILTKNYTKARHRYNKIKDNPYIRNEATYYGALLYIDMDNMDMAKDLLNEADNPESMLLLAGTMIEKDEKKRATQILQNLLTVKTVAADAAIWLAYVYRLENDLEKAQEILVDTLSNIPDNIELEWTYILIKDMIAPGENIPEVEKFASKHPMFHKALHLLSYHYLLAGEMEQSGLILNRAISIMPYDVEIINNLALFYLMEENSEQAEKLLRKAMSHKKHSVSVINNLAVLLMEKESYREAIEILNLSSDRDYESKILQYSRSYGRFMTNRYSELIAETDSDTEIADYPRMLMGLVSCIEINDKSKIEKFATRIRSYYPDSPETWIVLGYIAMTSGKTNEALLSWQRALAQTDNNSFLIAAYNKAFAKAKREQSAQEGTPIPPIKHEGYKREMQVNKDTLKKAISETIPLPQYIISKPIIEPKKSYRLLINESDNIFPD